jgi:hypothetical protein
VTRRWLGAFPLLLAGFVAVPLGRAALWARADGEPWSWSELALRSLPSYVVIAVLLFVLWRSPRYWARLTFLVSVVWAVVGLFAPGSATGLVLSVASVVLAWWLVHFAARVLTRPLDEELAASGLKVHVKSRTSRLRIEVERERVRLVSLGDSGVPPLANRLAIPFARLAFVQAGTLTSQSQGASWKLPNHRDLHLTDGPAIRIAGPGQEWLVPVDEAGQLAEFIRTRAARARIAGPGEGAERLPPVEERRRARVLLERESDRGSKLIRRYAAGSHHSYLVAAFLTSPAAVAAALAPDIEPVGRVLGTLLFGAISGFAGWHWWRLERAVRLFEEWPRSRDEPSQTIADESATPVSGWSSAYPSGMA